MAAAVPEGAAPGVGPVAAVDVDVDRMVHEPARLKIMATLYPLQQADFLFLERATGLTRGNLSSHLSRLEGAGYVVIEKTYRGKVPLTLVWLSAAGRTAFDTYRGQLRRIAESLPG
jgi:DNA-binding transcriptional ArsR family regulator